MAIIVIPTALQEYTDGAEEVQISGQTIGAVLKSLLTGRPVGQTMLDDVNYDAVAVQRLRSRTEAGERNRFLNAYPDRDEPVRR